MTNIQNTVSSNKDSSAEETDLKLKLNTIRYLRLAAEFIGEVDSQNTTKITVADLVGDENDDENDDEKDDINDDTNDEKDDEKDDTNDDTNDSSDDDSDGYADIEEGEEAPEV